MVGLDAVRIRSICQAFITVYIAWNKSVMFMPWHVSPLGIIMSLSVFGDLNTTNISSNDSW